MNINATRRRGLTALATLATLGFPISQPVRSADAPKDIVDTAVAAG